MKKKQILKLLLFLLQLVKFVPNFILPVLSQLADSNAELPAAVLLTQERHDVEIKNTAESSMVNSY